MISMKSLDLNSDRDEEQHLEHLQSQIQFPYPSPSEERASVSPTPATEESVETSSSTCDRDNSDSITSTDETTVKSTAIFSNPLSVPTTAIPSISSIASISQELRPTLQNIVSTVNLGIKLDLKKIALSARNSEYNPKRLNALIMRIRKPRTTALIFGTGKMVCTGAKDELMSRLSARKFARIIQLVGFNAKFTQFQIQNIVASCDLGFTIRLEALNMAHKQFSSYEAELFPGLVYRMVEPKIVLLIFVSGKVVLTGARYREQIFEGFDNILPILKSFKK